MPRVGSTSCRLAANCACSASRSRCRASRERPAGDSRYPTHARSITTSPISTGSSVLRTSRMLAISACLPVGRRTAVRSAGRPTTPRIAQSFPVSFFSGDSSPALASVSSANGTYTAAISNWMFPPAGPALPSPSAFSASTCGARKCGDFSIRFTSSTALSRALVTTTTCSTSWLSRLNSGFIDTTWMLGGIIFSISVKTLRPRQRLARKQVVQELRLVGDYRDSAAG